MTSLSGRLAPGALADLLQYLALSRASGCLLLRHPQRRQAYVYLENGRVVFVDARPLYDVAALSELLGWNDGRFAFRPGVAAPRAINCDARKRGPVTEVVVLNYDPGR